MSRIHCPVLYTLLSLVAVVPLEAAEQHSPLRPTINIELANGYFGYIPPPDQFPLGGYTTWRARSSCLEVRAEPKITAAVLELLDKVAKRRQDEQPIASK